MLIPASPINDIFSDRSEQWLVCIFIKFVFSVIAYRFALSESSGQIKMPESNSQVRCYITLKGHHEGVEIYIADVIAFYLFKNKNIKSSQYLYL